MIMEKFKSIAKEHCVGIADTTTNGRNHELVGIKKKGGTKVGKEQGCYDHFGLNSQDFYSHVNFSHWWSSKSQCRLHDLCHDLPGHNKFLSI